MCAEVVYFRTVRASSYLQALVSPPTGFDSAILGLARLPNGDLEQWRLCVFRLRKWYVRSPCLPYCSFSFVCLRKARSFHRSIFASSSDAGPLYRNWSVQLAVSPFHLSLELFTTALFHYPAEYRLRTPTHRRRLPLCRDAELSS